MSVMGWNWKTGRYETLKEEMERIYGEKSTHACRVCLYNGHCKKQDRSQEIQCDDFKIDDLEPLADMYRRKKDRKNKI
jgi:hypothetical protein